MAIKKSSRTQDGGVPLRLTKKNLAAIDQTMVNPNLNSFSTQMQRLSAKYIEVYLFTAYSAVPVADAVRGFHAAEHSSMPTMGFIKANRNVSRTYGSVYAQTVEQERDRLLPLLTDAETVCVVDQYVSSGRTIKLANEIVRAAGIEKIYNIRGNWYHDASASDMDLGTMTTTYSDDMLAIGRHAFEARH